MKCHFNHSQIQKIILSNGGATNAASIQEGKEGRKEDEALAFDLWDLIVNSHSGELKKLLAKAQHSDLPEQLASYVGGQETKTGMIIIIFDVML